MMTFEKKVSNRKLIVRRLAELTQIEPNYTRVPLCAYEIGPYTVDKEGHLNVEETEADPAILNKLITEELIDPGEWEADVTLLSVSYPLMKYNGEKLRNLVNLVYSRGRLLNLAVGSDFYVSRELVDALKDDACIYTVKNFQKALDDFAESHSEEEQLRGIRIKDSKVMLSGFPRDVDEAHFNANAKLAELMHKQAITQKRVQARLIEDENTKYSMRIWLIRIGMVGDEYKDTRHILLEKLSGQAAFRRDEDAALFFEREKRKREIAREERNKARAAAIAAQAEYMKTGKMPQAGDAAQAEDDAQAQDAAACGDPDQAEGLLNAGGAAETEDLLHTADPAQNAAQEMAAL